MTSVTLEKYSGEENVKVYRRDSKKGVFFANRDIAVGCYFLELFPSSKRLYIKQTGSRARL